MIVVYVFLSGLVFVWCYAFIWRTVARKIPFDDPDVLLYVRIGYVVTQTLCLIVYYYISQKVCVPLPPISLSFSLRDGQTHVHGVGYFDG